MGGWVGGWMGERPPPQMGWVEWAREGTGTRASECLKWRWLAGARRASASSAHLLLLLLLLHPPPRIARTLPSYTYISVGCLATRRDEGVSVYVHRLYSRRCTSVRNVTHTQPTPASVIHLVGECGVEKGGWLVGGRSGLSPLPPSYSPPADRYNPHPVFHPLTLHPPTLLIIRSHSKFPRLIIFATTEETERNHRDSESRAREWEKKGKKKNNKTRDFVKRKKNSEKFHLHRRPLGRNIALAETRIRVHALLDRAVSGRVHSKLHLQRVPEVPKVRMNEIYKKLQKLQVNKINWNLKKHFKKSHFLSQKLIFHWLKKIGLKKVILYFFRSHERSELPVNTDNYIFNLSLRFNF